MTLLGREYKNFSLPLCSVFQPRLLNGQLCYSVDVNKVSGLDAFEQGPNNGLTLFIDYNDERMIDINDGFGKKGTKFKTNIHDHHQYQKVKIYMNTLKPFIGYGPGNYEMSAIKIMDTTEDFVSLPEDVRGCQMQYTTMNCQLEDYMQQAAEICRCSPISLLSMVRNMTVSN